MPKLWTDTIDDHRREVRDAILHAGARLAAERGLASVTMSEIAEETGIGRTTLYKYFPDVEAILSAWHERQVAAHLEQLAQVRDHATNRLEAVLEAYALMTFERPHGTELAALLHRGEHVMQAQRQLAEFLRLIIAEQAQDGELRDDVSPEELALYCLHALSAASGLPSRASVRRLVDVTLAGLRSSE